MSEQWLSLNSLNSVPRLRGWVRLEQMGLTRTDLVDILGSRNGVSEVPNRYRPISITMISKLRDKLGISADILIGSQRRAA